MNEKMPEAKTIQQLGRASRISALISLAGFILVLGAIFFSTGKLKTVEKQRTILVENNAKLKLDIEQKAVSLDSVSNALSRSRASLSAARAAINAFHSGDLNFAVKLYDEALEMDPENAYLLNLKAYSLFRLKRIDEAIETQKRSLAIDPDYAWGYFDLARFLYASSPSKIDQANAAEKRALELRPDMRNIMEYDGEFRNLKRRAHN